MPTRIFMTIAANLRTKLNLLEIGDSFVIADRAQLSKCAKQVGIRVKTKRLPGWQGITVTRVA